MAQDLNININILANDTQSVKPNQDTFQPSLSNNNTDIDTTSAAISSAGFKTEIKSALRLVGGNLGVRQLVKIHEASTGSGNLNRQIQGATNLATTFIGGAIVGKSILGLSATFGLPGIIVGLVAVGTSEVYRQIRSQYSIVYENREIRQLQTELGFSSTNSRLR